MSAESALPTPIRKLLSEAELVLEAPYTRRVFTNRDLAFDRVPVVGFDMDYTLALYRQDELEKLSIRCTLDKLIARGYPEALRDIKSDPTFAIRGLVVDKKFGNIIKMDRHGYVGRAYHGKHLLPRARAQGPLPGPAPRHRARALRPRRHPVRPARGHALRRGRRLHRPSARAVGRRRPPTYAQAWTDVRECIDKAHQDGSLKDLIQADLGRYFQVDPELGSTLHKFRSAGKKLFLLTNSLLPYTADVMGYVLGGQLAAYGHWRDYFDWIVVGARKPEFFIGNQPFQELDLADRPLGKPVAEPKRGRIYLGGNQQGLQAALGVHSDEVLYVGDHIYGDIVKSKKSSGWRTALIIEDLEHELAVRKDRHITLKEIEHLTGLRIALADDVAAQRYLSRLLARLTPEELIKQGVPAAEAEHMLAETRASVRKRFDRLRKYEEEVADTLERRIADVDEAFNPYWGSVFAARRDTSRFGAQVESYACIYTSRVTNFRYASPVKYFHSPHGSMPHWHGPPK
jgi:5'-nucleotidase